MQITNARRRVSSRASLRQVTFAESPGDAIIIGQLLPLSPAVIVTPADEDDHHASSNVTRRLHFYKDVCGHHWTTVVDQLRINHAMEMETRQASAVESLVTDRCCGATTSTRCASSVCQLDSKLKW